MKTPKREKAKLWKAVAESANESLTWGEILCSRWKRKNKEAQLKRTIARLQREHAKSEIEYQRKLVHWRGRACAAEIACETLYKICDFMNTACLQDQEGS